MTTLTLQRVVTILRHLPRRFVVSDLRCFSCSEPGIRNLCDGSKIRPVTVTTTGAWREGKLCQRSAWGGRNWSSQAATSSKSGTCPMCAQEYNLGKDLISAVSCPKCGALRRETDGLPNYFEILGQEMSYRVDLQQMANRAKQLQKKFHPDLYSQKGSEQQELSQEYSSLINKALTTLFDPISRGRYMLTLFGLSDQDSADIERSMTKDPEFLEEVMELNEALEEINSENDWKEFRSRNDETMKQIQRDLEVAFDAKDVKLAQRLINRMKYFDTLQDKLKDVQSRIGIVE